MLTLEQELEELKERVERLEADVRVWKNGEKKPRPPKPGPKMTQAEVMAWLRAEGIIREPTPEDLRLAAEWDALPEEEKEATRWELDHLPPGPMVSDIVIEARRSIWDTTT